MSEMTVVTARDIDIVTAEINTIKVQTSCMIVTNAIEIGRRLVEAKSMVKHGEWGKYLQERVNYSQSTANNLMALYKEYGDKQESLFDSFANSQTFGNLTYSKALKLLAIPAEERENFAETHDIENMSTRELQKAIEERDKAIQERDAAIQQRDMANADAQKAEKLAEDLATAEQAKARAEKSENNALGLVEKIKKQLADAQAAEAAAKADMKKAKENPNVPDSVMEQLRKEAEADAAKKATAEIQQQLDAAKKSAEDAVQAKEAAEQAAKAAEEKLAAAQKAAQLSSPNAAVFKAIFEQVQQDFKRLCDTLKTVQAEDPTVGGKLQAATVALLDKLRKDVEK